LKRFFEKLDDLQVWMLLVAFSTLIIPNLGLILPFR